jgi:hypothetical protein
LGWSALEQLLHRAACNVLADNERLARLITNVIDGDDVRMVTEAAHRLGFAADARESRFVQPLGFDQGEGDVTVELGVVRQIDPLFCPLTEKVLDLIAAGGEGCGQWGAGAHGSGGGPRHGGAAGVAESGVGPHLAPAFRATRCEVRSAAIAEDGAAPTVASARSARHERILPVTARQRLG